MTELSDESIISEREAGRVVIEPFNLADVNTASYDVRLGPWYYREQATCPTGDPQIVNIYSPDAAPEMWGEKQYAELASDWMNVKSNGIDWRGIHPTDRVILIRPQENLLCHTLEFIGGKSNITTQMKARSTIGRLLLNVCQCAGQSDVGYYNRWTMEVYNRSRYRPILLVVGRRVAQIVFDRTDPTGRSYAENGNYQESEDVKAMIGRWHPDMMLPKAHLDRDIRQ